MRTDSGRFLFGVITVLVFAKDLDWLRDLPAHEIKKATLYIAIEVLFVIAVMLGMFTISRAGGLVCPFCRANGDRN